MAAGIAKLVGDFFLILGSEICRKLGGNCAGFGIALRSCRSSSVNFLILESEILQEIWREFCGIRDQKKGVMGHYERGLQSLESLESLKSLGISRKCSDSPLFSTVWGFSRISRISELS